MNLASFIRANQQTIIAEWENFARSVPSGEDMGRVALRDHVVALLDFVVLDLEAYQSERERDAKSKGRGGDDALDNVAESAGESHAEQRFTGGFDTVEMISEFRALRASVIKLWRREGVKSAQDLEDLVRFNEAIDQIMTESLVRYTEKINQARMLFLGMLMHDLHNPLGAVYMSAQLMPIVGPLNDKQQQLAQQVEVSTQRISHLVSTLIDEVRIRLGQGLPITPAPMDIEETMHQAVQEIRTAHPERTVSLVTAGNLEGVWDHARLSQALSNLIGNAIQHGVPAEKICVEAKEDADGVVISVQNKGTPIPKELLSKIFDPMTRGIEKAQDRSQKTSMGLGLFITKGIIEAHGGKIDVQSSAEKGTVFTARLPRVSEPSKVLAE